MNLIKFSIINKIKNYLLINNKLIFIIFSAYFILSLKFININIYIFFIILIISSTFINLKYIKNILFINSYYALLIIISFVFHYFGLLTLDQNSFITVGPNTASWGMGLLKNTTNIYLLFPLLYILSISIFCRNHSPCQFLLYIPFIFLPSQLVSLYQIFINPDFLISQKNYICGLSLDASSFGISLFLILPLCVLGFVLNKELNKKYLFIFSAMLTILCLLIRGQETTLLGIIIFLLIFPCIWMWVNSAELIFKKTLLFSLIYTLFLLLLCYGAFLLSEIKTLQSFALVSKFNDHLISLDKIGIGGMIQEAFQKTGRLDHWLQACRLTIESPIAGWGPGGFMRNLGNIYYRYKEPFSFFDNANNQYLQMSSDLGFLGAYLNLLLHLFPLLMIIGIHRHIRSKEERWAVGISFSVVSIMMILYMTGPHIMAPDVLFIMVIYLSFLIVTAIKFGFSFKHFNIKRYAVPIVLITALFSFESYNNAFGEKGYTLRQEANWWPLINHYGYYPLEEVNGQMMMWTGRESSVQIPAKTNLVNINVLTNHYNTADNGLFFKVFIDGTVGIEHHFFNGDYKPFYCFVPNIKSKEILVKTWVDKTFSPQKMGIGKDDRNLGVMISPLNFLVDILPKDGIGFYNWENVSASISSDWPKDQQFKFRWTGIRASIDVENYLSNSITIFLHSSHPDLRNSPVTVQLIGEKEVIKEVVFTHYDWQKITITPAMLNGSTILTLQA